MRFSVFLGAFVVSACATTSVDELSTSDPVEIVRRRVLDFGVAYRDGDVAAVDALLADPYVHSNAGHLPGDRASYLEWNRKRSARLESGQWRVTAYEVSEVKVTVWGDTAIATGRVVARGERDGSPWASDVRFTNVWILRSKEWRRAAFHDAPTQ